MSGATDLWRLFPQKTFLIVLNELRVNSSRVEAPVLGNLKENVFEKYIENPFYNTNIKRKLSI